MNIGTGWQAHNMGTQRKEGAFRFPQEIAQGFLRERRRVVEQKGSGVDQRLQEVSGQLMILGSLARGVGYGMAGTQLRRKHQRIAPPLQADLAHGWLMHDAQRYAGEFGRKRCKRQKCLTLRRRRQQRCKVAVRLAVLGDCS